MWSPTHVQVTVQRAKGLLTKGKHGMNDAFVTIALGKEKYQTSVKEKSGPDVEWHEECDLLIPKQGNTAELVLTVLHRSFLGVDEFLGVVSIPLADFDVYERPKNRWYALKSKTKKEKERGELEVKISFLVKAGSLMDLTKKEKHKSSLGQLSHITHSIGGSLLSIGSLERKKGLKKLTKSLGNKISLKHKKDKLKSSGSVDGSEQTSQVVGDADPGVISEGESEDGFTFDELSHKSSGSSLNMNSSSTVRVGDSLENLAGGEFLRRTSSINSTDGGPPRPAATGKKADEWEQKLYGRYGKDTLFKARTWDGSKIASNSPTKENDHKESTGSQKSVTSSPVLNHSQECVKSSHEGWDLHGIKEEEEKENLILKSQKVKHLEKNRDIKASEVFSNEVRTNGTHNLDSTSSCRVSPENLQKFNGHSKEDLIELVCGLQSTVEHQNRKLAHIENYMKDLEDYLDNLLLRVMETTPRILQNPYVTYKMEKKYGY
ncbi:rab11 family-interacting protein 2 isoform X1 [Bacillus rossius redtenbacheri]|uniref:rab11 family-interacting protein 2 isoform X1 n=1 Tax=Bacillus rossius redtenbacheri TaxID=93214 RepID=UPI002FDD999F